MASDILLPIPKAAHPCAVDWRVNITSFVLGLGIAETHSEFVMSQKDEMGLTEEVGDPVADMDIVLEVLRGVSVTVAVIFEELELVDVAEATKLSLKKP